MMQGPVQVLTGPVQVLTTKWRAAHGPADSESDRLRRSEGPAVCFRPGGPWAIRSGTALTLNARHAARSDSACHDQAQSRIWPSPTHGHTARSH